MKKQKNRFLAYAEREMARGFAAGGGNVKGLRFKRLMDEFRRKGSNLKGLS